MQAENPTRGIGRRDFAERRASRIARLEARAVKKSAEAQRLLTKNDALLGVMNGTPVLRGHHSEGRHRRDLARIDNDMRKSFAAAKDAERLKQSAVAAAYNIAISSDDPDAISKLQQKLAVLIASQQKSKDINALVRKHRKAGPAAQLAALVGIGLSEKLAAKIVQPDDFGNTGVPAYALTNQGAEIRRIQARLEQLQRAAAMPELDEMIGEVRLRTADNRVQLIFAGKPTDAIRAELKRNGFRWAPSEGAWQRQPTPYAISEARRIALKVST